MLHRAPGRMEPSAALQCALAGGVPLSPPFAGMGLGLEVALALEPDEGGELLVLLLRQGVGDAGDESLDQRDPLFGRERARLVDQGAEHRMVHPVGFGRRRHVVDGVGGWAGDRRALSDRRRARHYLIAPRPAWPPRPR